MSRIAVIALTTLTLMSGGLASAAELKIATIAPDGSFWMTEVRKGADEIATRTSSRVTFRLYPGGTMGNDQAVLRKMRIGQLHGGAILAGSLAAIDPDVQIYSLPLVFRSYDEVDYVRQRMDQQVVGRLAAQGYVSFGMIEGGFAYLMSQNPKGTSSARRSSLRPSSHRFRFPCPTC
jgi:TRAP-type C4-dicarboxylate transport system substrate-binding protein